MDKQLGTYRIYSFDVFDTCITRRYSRPADLFFQLGMRLAGPHATMDQKIAFATRFTKARILGERKANSAVRPYECATISEVYAYVEFDELLDLERKKVVDAEIQLERECIYVVTETLERIKNLRQHGAKIIFVSDMYLPSTVIESILRDLELMQDGDTLYVSCDARLSKHSGNLFKHILKKESVRPQDVLHVGDNGWGDVKVPQQLGIAVEPFATASLTSHEIRTAGVRRLSISPQRSFLASLSRESRLRMAGNASNSFDEVIHSTIAPLLVAYVAWVVHQARASGIKRLYFVARDGEVMLKIANHLGSFSEDLELKYLYGSRRAWHPASILRDSQIWTRALTPLGQIHTSANILNRIGLCPADKIEIFRLLNISESKATARLNSEGCSEFIKDLVCNERVAEIILASSSTAREIVLEYFQQEGLLDDMPWALVDTGWSLNCQAALKRILSTRIDVTSRPIGYYLALMDSRLDEKSAGIAHSFISNPEIVFCRRRTMIEHCFTPATHATTKGYVLHDGTVYPLLGEEARCDAELIYINRLHEICVAQAEIVGSCTELFERMLSAAEEAIILCEEFISKPLKEDVEPMLALSAAADFFHETSFTQPFCGALGFSDLRKLLLMTFSRKARFAELPFVWLEGACVLSPAYIKIPALFMLRGKLFISRLVLRYRRFRSK